MKRAVTVTLASVPEKKARSPVVQFVPLETIEIPDPILDSHTDSAESDGIMQFVTDSFKDDETETTYSIVEHMDIRKPLTTLQSLLEQRLGTSLTGYTFYLQDVQELDITKNLVNQCVQGEGMVQINVDVIKKAGLKKINIVDVLKPAEEIALTSGYETQGSDTSNDSVTKQTVSECADSQISTWITNSNETSTVRAETEQITRWIAAADFKTLQDRLKIPQDPEEWTEEHVRLWARWASTRFIQSKINLKNWKLDGKALMLLSREEFQKKVPKDPGDLFWTHLELLRKCKIVAVLHQPAVTQDVNRNVTKSSVKTTKPIGVKSSYESSLGNSGQIQLWQFLLELLTDKDHLNHIQWIGSEGEFKLLEPEAVAHLWGLRKNKPTMNYEKLSRALRYYYDGEMIAKVHGKRFVYKFVCDLKSLMGYDAAELSRLVTESVTMNKRQENR